MSEVAAKLPFQRWRCHAAAAITAIVFVGPIVFIATDRTLPVTISTPTVNPPQVRPGQTAYIEFLATYNYPIFGNCTGSVVRTMVDSGGRVFTFDAVPSIIIDNEQSVPFSRPFTVPLGMSRGKAKLRGRSTIVCNFFQSWFPLHYQQDDATFEVID